MDKINWNNWSSLGDISPKEFTCGYCGREVASNKGYFHNQGDGTPHSFLYICTNCGRPTYFHKGHAQFPGPLIGRDINHLPDDVEEIYKEIRDSMKNSTHTAVLLLGRKLIMHLAVDVAKSPEKANFIDYIEHLKKSGYIPPQADKWLEFMRKQGGDKNHQIQIGTQEEAQKIIKFVEILLLYMYEFPQEMAEDKSKSEEA